MIEWLFEPTAQPNIVNFIVTTMASISFFNMLFFFLRIQKIQEDMIIILMIIKRMREGEDDKN